MKIKLILRNPDNFSETEREMNRMYLQGNLQNIFDALYHMGVIDPVLERDWPQAMEEMRKNTDKMAEIVSVVNTCQADVDLLMAELEQFDEKLLEYLAMEVAREFADFHSRGDLH